MKKQTILKWGAILVSFSIALKMYWTSYVDEHLLLAVPSEMGVRKVIFYQEDSNGRWSFGPGGNDGIVVAYALPSDTEEKIRKNGLEYFSGLTEQYDGNEPQRQHESYRKWYSTPLDADWVTHQTKCECLKHLIGIAGYLNMFIGSVDLSLNLNPEIEREINEAITSPGNFYAHGNFSIIIVSPALHKIFFIFAN